MSFRARVFAAAAVLLAATAFGGAQAPAGAQLAGIVVDGKSGESLGGVVVAITGRGIPQQRIVVDPRGRFAFDDLPAGVFGVQASKPGYLGGGSGQQEPMGLPHPLELAAGARVTDLTLRLWKLGAIDGTVSGDADEPLTGVDVHALRRTLIGGRWRLTDTASVTTDDRGHYRLSGLPPGDYTIAARPPRTRDVALLLATLSANPAVAADIMTGATMSGRGDLELDARMRDYSLAVYAPAPGARAPFVAIEPETERTALDFHLKAARLVRVSGIAIGAGAVDAGLTVRLMPAGSPPDVESLPIDAAVATCDDEGHFALSGVSPGRYVAVVLQPPAPPQGPNPPPVAAAGVPSAAPPLPADPTWWARLPITVGATDLTGVTLQVRRGFAVSGRVEFEGAAPPAAIELAQITLRLDPIDRPAPAGPAPVWRGRVETDGRFNTMGVPPGEYLVRVLSPPRGWSIQSALSDGRDVLDEPIVVGDHDVAGVTVLLGTRPLASIAGTVRGADGAAAPESTVVIFPASRGAWRDTSPLARRLRAVRPAQSGGYGVQGLPAGEYLVVAIAGNPSPSWQDPAQLDALAKTAARVRLEPGATRTLDVRVNR